MIVYGAPEGPAVVYFHGSPGAAVEAGRFDDAARAAGVRLFALERAEVPPAVAGAAYFDQLAAMIAAEVGDHPFVLAGFSMGAGVALRTAARLARRPAHLHLVAPALPTDRYDDMAGQAVFEAARIPARLRRLVSVQRLVARWAPGLMVRLLFASASGQDAALARDPAFRAWLAGVLREGLGQGAAAFERDLIAYAAPWSAEPPACPTTLWLGEADSWAPPRLAEPLLHAAPQIRAERLEGAGHYSTLMAALPRIFAEAGART